MMFLRYAVFQCDGYLSMKRMALTDKRRENHMKAKREDIHLQSKLSTQNKTNPADNLILDF